jgi:hypothetical protein
MLAPSRKDEKALVKMLSGLKEYHELLDSCDTTAARAILNQGLSDIARGLQTLIQGPKGRLDAELLARELEPYLHGSGLSLVDSATDPQREAV